jgi:cytochrome c oxidase subunit IV
MSREDVAAIWNLTRVPFLALIALTVLLISTVSLAYVHMGSMNLVVSLLIALAKVSIIVAIFMELPKASGVQILAASVGVFWLSFLFLLGFADYLSR